MSLAGPRKKFHAFEYAAFGLLTVALLVSAMLASFLGSLRSLAGFESSPSLSAFVAMVCFAAGGPHIVFLVTLLAGCSLYAVGRRAWYVPLIGTIVLILLFSAAAGSLT